MSRLWYAIAAVALTAASLGVAAHAQQPTPPPFATTKVDGTDNVYVFRYGGHQSMFVVTSAGRDRHRSHRLRASAGGDDLRRRDQEGHEHQPIKYLIYSHHHFDHIAGGKPFKDAGATVVAHAPRSRSVSPRSGIPTPCWSTR